MVYTSISALLYFLTRNDNGKTLWYSVFIFPAHVIGHVIWWPLLEPLSWYPLILVKLLQLIWRLGTQSWNLWVFKLDESTARWHLKSARSPHLWRSCPRSNPMVTFEALSSICLLSVSWQSDHFWLRHSKFHIWPWKLKVKDTAKKHLVTLEALSSINMFVFCFVAIGPFLAEI